MKASVIIISSSWKFAATFPVAIYLFKMSFFETILYTNIGGLAGIIVFTLFSKVLLRIVDDLWSKNLPYKKRTKKIFTGRNRRLIFLKNKIGLPGIIILTPVLLSIPVGVFLITKYFARRKISYLYLFAMQIVWSFVYTITYTRVKTAL